jgi:Ca2+-binding EF-hand superfamily protein
MFKEKGLQIITGLTTKIKEWPHFIKKLRENADPDDIDIIDFKKFLGVTSTFTSPLSEKERETVMQAFVCNQDRQNVKINIGRLYSIKFTKKIRKIYDKLDMYEEMEDNDLVDNSGYFGIFYREKVALEAIGEKEFIKIIHANNKMVLIMKNIKEIDKDNNGYVTN